MDHDFENPFADYGNIVRGERFIGRQDDLRVIENRIIRTRSAGNLAIIGEPRIGKSSLIYNALIEQKDKLIEKKQLPIWINMATYDQPRVFFRSLVSRCLSEMEDLSWASTSIRKAADSALQNDHSWSDGYWKIQRFFEKVRQAGFNIIFVLDEFDSARHLFRGNISGFQGLRELSYNPEWSVTYVTASRRTIRDIELQSQAISTFALIFRKHYLSMFTDDDLDEYFHRLTSVGILDTVLLRERIDFYCGRHPYLLEMLGYEVVEVFREQQSVDVDEAAQRITQDFLAQYDQMISLLREDGKQNKLLQILFGPIIDVRQTDVDELLRYGFIKSNEQDIYIAFSGHFQAYLNLIERDVDMDLWPVWRQTEITLRNIVTTTMLEEYGEHWVKQLEKTRPNLKTIFKQCRNAQEKEKRSFGGRASDNLIDFTYPQDLFTIIFAEWSSFKSILGKDKNHWSQRSNLLARIRNPLAHNRNRALYDHERTIAEGYCQEILALKDSNL